MRNLKNKIAVSICAIIGLFCAVGLAGAVTAAQTRVGPEKTALEKKMETWWADLDKPEPAASRALLRLADHPRQTVLFLKARLKPLKLSKMRLETLLIQIGSDKKEIWQAAFEQLEYFDPRLTMDLEKLMEKVTETPTRQRLVEVLSGRTAGSLGDMPIRLRPVGDDGYNFSSRGSWWAEHKVSRLNIGYSNQKKKWTRAVRAIVLLKHIGSPEAIAIVKAMAVGHPEAQPTKAAKEALSEMKNN